MLKFNTLPALTVKHISEIEPGNSIINLGEVLETIEEENEFSLIIFRMDQKQVLKFDKQEYLIVRSI